MLTIDFLKDILPPLTDGGNYVITTRTIYGKRKWFANRSFNNIDEITKLVEGDKQSKLLEGNSYDEIYFALGEFKDNISQNEFRQKKVTRLKSQATAFYCLAQDIDVGENKPYLTQADAIRALREAMATVDIKHYGIVSSGNGVHFYVLLDDVVSAGDWGSFSKKLYIGLKAAGLQVDASKAFDQSMVLRPVGSYNKKDVNNYKKVDVIEWTDYRYNYTHIEALLSPYSELIEEVIKDTPQRLVDFTTDATADYLEIEKGCPQLHQLSLSAEVPEPHWYTAIGVAAYCKDAESAAIRWSENYSKYNKAEVIRKLNHWRKVGAGPATCNRFMTHNPLGCEECKYKGTIKTPLMAKEFKREYAVKDGEDIVFPYGYYIKEEFGYVSIYKTVPDEDPIKVLDGYLVYVEGIAKLFHERNPQTFVKIRYQCPFMDEPALLEVPLDSVTSTGKSDSVISKLAGAGVIVEANRVKLVQDYIYACTKQKQRASAPSIIAESFGWQNNNHFIWGLQSIGKTSSSLITAKNSTITDMAKSYVAKGELSEWVKLTNMFRVEENHLAAFVMFLGFAAPLMKFTKLGGCLINLYSPESGSGKTTAGNVALSIYGNPELGKTGVSPNDTDTAVFLKLGAMNNLPMFIDEVSEWSPQRVSDMIYYASQGNEKGRATKDIELRKSASWNTVIITSSNQSLMDKLNEHTLSNDGQKQRLLEITLDRSEFFTKFGKVLNAVTLARNYGTAGEVYIKHLVALHSSGLLEDRALNAREEFEKELNFEFLGEERFIAATISSAYLGAKYAIELGLINSSIDLRTIFSKICKVVKTKRANAVEAKEDAFDAVHEFISSHQDKLVKVKTINANNPPSLGSCPDREVAGRLELWYKSNNAKEADAGVISISLTAFKRFCQDTKRPYQRYLNQLRDGGLNFKSHKMVLTSGLNTTLNGSTAPKVMLATISMSIPKELLGEYKLEMGSNPLWR